MEARKIQRVGSSTLAISLPKGWVETLGLKKGDIVYFDSEENGILKLIVNAERKKEKSVEIVEVYADHCTDPKMLSKILVGNYILGRDIIKVMSNTRLKSAYVDEIRATIRGLMGIAIMEETPNQVVLQSSIDITQFPVETLIRRLFIIGSTMYKETLDALFESKTELAKDTIQRKNEADTMFWVIVRLLDSAQTARVTVERIRIQNSMQILWYRFVAECLWRIANWSEKIANKVIALESNREVLGELLLKETLKLSENAYSIYHKAMNSVFSSEIELANKAIEDCATLQKMEEKLQERLCSETYLKGKSFSVTPYFKGKEDIEPCLIAQLSFILSCIRRTAEIASEIADIAITKALYNQTKICAVSHEAS